MSEVYSSSREEILTFTAEIEREIEGAARGSYCVARGGYVLHPASSRKRWNIRCHAKQEKGHAVEGKRGSEDIDGFTRSKNGPPAKGGNQVDGGDDVELLSSLSNLTRQKCDLVRVGCNDLSLHLMSALILE